MSSETQRLAEQVKASIDNRYLYGHGELLELLLIAYLSRGHVLLEGPPGTAKTHTAKLLAHLLAKQFKRIQFTTDMLPSDIIGAYLFSPAKQEFKFLPGPVFTDFVVADEINRTPPRTQSALLEGMEERQVTVEGNRHLLSPDFFVLATQNPFEFEGTFPLPEVQMDRFLFKLQVDHAPAETEAAVLRSILDGVLPPRFDELSAIPFNRELVDKEIQAVRTDPSILKYVSQLTHATRKHSMLSSGASIRAGIAIVKCSRVLALFRGRDFVTPDEVKALALPVLRHRVRLTPEAQLSLTHPDQVLSEIIKSVEFPK